MVTQYNKFLTSLKYRHHLYLGMVDIEYLKPIATVIERQISKDVQPNVRRETDVLLSLFNQMDEDELVDVHNSCYRIMTNIQNLPGYQTSPTMQGMHVYEFFRVQTALAVIRGREEFDESRLLGGDEIVDFSYDEMFPGGTA